MKFSAVIFDLDGTVLLNEDVYASAFLAILAKHGVRADTPGVDSRIVHTPGVGVERNWEIFKKRYNLPSEVGVDQLVHETQDEYHKRLPEVGIRPGFFNLHGALAEEGIQIALATSNDWWLVEDELTDLGLLPYFNVTVTREEVVNPKPEPDIFWKAAEKLGVPEEACVVIEDSIAGIKAAGEAGMKVIAVLGTNTDKKGLREADLVVENFYEINPQIIDGLFG